MQKIICLYETWYSGVFGITAYESEYKMLEIQNGYSNMAD